MFRFIRLSLVVSLAMWYLGKRARGIEHPCWCEKGDSLFLDGLRWIIGRGLA